MDILQSIIIGAIQGLAEFLPVSSSGHLVLFPYIFKLDYQGLAFDVALHFGTAIAIIAYFWRDWISIVAKAMKIRNPATNYPDNLLWQIIVASIPAAIAGYFLNDYVEKFLHSPLLIAFNLIVFGIILWLADKKSNTKYQILNTKYPQSFLVGCAQAVSLIPGVSRSGITITAARLQGMDRETAARFSFLLSTPAILGAFLFKVKDLEKIDFQTSFWLAVASATFFGFIAIKYLLQYLRKSDFSVFLWYRVVLAIVVFWLYLAR